MAMSKNGYPIHVAPKPSEPVRHWVERFVQRKGIGSGLPPSRVDFDAHGVYPFVAITKNNNEEDHVEARRYTTSLLAETFQPEDYFFSACLRVWFTDNDKAMTFKLCWNR